MGWCLELSKEGGQKLFAAWKFGESRNLGEGDDFVIHDAGFDLKTFVIFRELGDDLGGGDGIGTEKYCGGTFEEGTQVFGQLLRFFFKSEAHKVILGDEKFATGFIGFGAEQVLFFDGKTGVFGENNSLRIV